MNHTGISAWTYYGVKSMQLQLTRGGQLLTRTFNRRAFRLVKLLYLEVKEDDMLGLAAELAFRFFLALFPFFIFLAALGGFVADTAGVDNPTEEIINLFGESLPPDTESVLRTQLDAVIGSHNAGLLSFGVIGAIIAASGGVGTIMKAANRAYNVRERRKLLVRYGISFVLTISGGLMLIAAFVLFLSGQVYGTELADRLGMAGLTAVLMNVARWLVVILLSLLAASVLYWAAPSIKLRFRLITPGALLFAAGWLAMTYGFGLYVSRFSSFNTTYGTLGGVVIILTWFYLSGAILLLGAEVNALLHVQAQAGEPQ